ncbi:hypothetical protein O0I10_009389 [Lichtheimia ornata]|uniref:Uncharacterized protein n=1 Tax=Lichtheimia ornata TaxID=688661 RepID=A0AAD7UWL7_9FUNG|nr:uncharacterized protein O0I10_009389 [Lichtheimia ornata]KAJ8654993.1 hypothetical protein O0I10_009389 [Lichtheimia ornata]
MTGGPGMSLPGRVDHVYVDAAEDDDGSDSVDKRASTLDERQWITLEYWRLGMYVQYLVCNMDEDAYDGGNQGYNNTTTMMPADSM